MSWIVKFLARLFLGPMTPPIEAYLQALKSQPFEPVTEPMPVVFSPDEQRFKNEAISVIYYQNEYAETVDLLIFGEFGGLVITAQEGQIVTVTKDGVTYKNPELEDIDKFVFFQILDTVRRVSF